MEVPISESLRPTHPIFKSSNWNGSRLLKNKGYFVLNLWSLKLGLYYIPEKYLLKFGPQRQYKINECEVDLVRMFNVATNNIYNQTAFQSEISLQYFTLIILIYNNNNIIIIIIVVVAIVVG